MRTGPFRIALDGASALAEEPTPEGGDVSAMAYPSPRPRATLLLAHGAGASQTHPYVVATAQRLAARGVSVMTFDFAYMEQGRKIPDKNDALESCFRAALDAARERADGPLFAGGKSMGGRIASQVAAKGAKIAGLVFLGYPLHPPGKPEQRRDKHLPSVRAPMLFVQGTRDPFGGPDEIAPLIPKLAKRTRLYAIEGGDHSHAVPKRAGVAQEDVYAGIADAIVEWMDEVLARS